MSDLRERVKDNRQAGIHGSSSLEITFALALFAVAATVMLGVICHCGKKTGSSR